MKNKSFLGSILLTVTAFIWGSAFVAQSVGMDYLKPFTFNGIRCLIAAAALFITSTIIDFCKKKKGTYKELTKKQKKDMLRGGFTCGIALFLASSVQQYGISMTSVGKAGFISVMYIIIVPFYALLQKQRLPKMIWVSVPLALTGLFFLCVTESINSINIGDIIVLLSAFLYAIHIIAVDRYAPLIDGVKLSLIQFFVAGTISLFFMLFFDQPDVSAIKSAWFPLFYAGALSGGLAYTLQIIGQKWTVASVASLLMSMESVFAVLTGIVILKQIPSPKELLGCALMFTAIILIQLPEKNTKKIKE